jgi:hypothetical protein
MISTRKGRKRSELGITVICLKQKSTEKSKSLTVKGYSVEEVYNKIKALFDGMPELLKSNNQDP